MAIGRKLVEQKTLHRTRRRHVPAVSRAAGNQRNPSAFDVKGLVAERRKEREAAYAVRPRLWAGTITHWSLHEEPYKQGVWDWPGIYERSKESAKQPADTLRGLGASAGVVEGIARVVDSPDEFDQVQKGELLVCKMTSPSWVVLFTKIAGLGHRFWRGAVASRRRVAGVRHPGGGRDPRRHAEDQDGPARARQRRGGDGEMCWGEGMPSGSLPTSNSQRRSARRMG